MNELHQPIASYDLTRRNRNVAANLERLCTDGLLPFDNAPLVFPEVRGTTHEIHPTLLKRGFEHLGVCEQEIRGRDHVEQLARDEGHDVLVMCFDALHAGRRVMPPLLREQEAL